VLGNSTEAWCGLWSLQDVIIQGHLLGTVHTAVYHIHCLAEHSNLTLTPSYIISLQL